MTFQNLEIIRPILDAISLEGYENPSPIQVEAMPIIFSGRDLLASAQTGTGKTAAFAIPIVQSLHLNKTPDTPRVIKALVLSPTRELAEQIKVSFRTYIGQLNLKVGAIYGGVAQKGQESMLNKGIDILIATPGRLIDLMKQKVVKLNDVKYFVLDEADTLLDMGFINDVKYIKGFIPRERQTMMFSATISKSVANLASTLLNEPQQLELAPADLMLENINHSMFYANKNHKNELLLDLLTNPTLVSVLVFTRTKRGANDLAKFLGEYGLKVDAIHGNKTQGKRQLALDNFKTRKTRVLIATDIAARGIDIDDLSHVINFDLPENGETYVHRIGRTGRKGLKGQAISFVSKNEIGLLKAIQRHTGLDIKVLKLEPVKEDSKFQKVVADSTRKEETAFEKKANNMKAKIDKYFDKKRAKTSNQVEQEEAKEEVKTFSKREENKNETRKVTFAKPQDHLSKRPYKKFNDKKDDYAGSERKSKSYSDFPKKSFDKRNNENGYQNRPNKPNTWKKRNEDTTDLDGGFLKSFEDKRGETNNTRSPRNNTWKSGKSYEQRDGEKSFKKTYNRTKDNDYQPRSDKPNSWSKSRTNDGKSFEKSAQKPFQKRFVKENEATGEKRTNKEFKPFNSFKKNSQEKPFRNGERKSQSGEKTFGRKPFAKSKNSFGRNNIKG